MVIKKLKPGMQVWSVRRTKHLSSIFDNCKWDTWPVYIEEVDTENKRVFASWNNNPCEWYNENTWKNWRIKNPNYESKK